MLCWLILFLFSKICKEGVNHTLLRYTYQNQFDTININFPNQIYKFDLYVLFRCFEPEIYSTYFQDLTMSFSLRNEETTFTKPQYMIKFVQLPCPYFCVRLHLCSKKTSI